jgi:hypothetical protein
MLLLKKGNKYYHVLHQYDIYMYEEKYDIYMYEEKYTEYIILQEEKVILFTDHDWWGNHKFWTIEQISDNIDAISSRNYRNPQIKKRRLEHWEYALKLMKQYYRDHKIDEITLYL